MYFGLTLRPWLPKLKERLTSEIRDGIKSRAELLGKNMVKKTLSKSGHRQQVLGSQLARHPHMAKHQVTSSFKLQ